MISSTRTRARVGWCWAHPRLSAMDCLWIAETGGLCRYSARSQHVDDKGRLWLLGGELPPRAASLKIIL
jgi:hypothetical protein